MDHNGHAGKKKIKTAHQTTCNKREKKKRENEIIVYTRNI